MKEREGISANIRGRRHWDLLKTSPEYWAQCLLSAPVDLG